MRLTQLLALAVLLCGCAGSKTEPQQREEPSAAYAIPELELKELADFRSLEAAAESELIQSETNYISQSAISLDQPLIYRKTDDLLPGVPLVVRYFPATDDSLVRKLEYEWGGQEGKPFWVQQPMERFEAFKQRYQALRDRVIGVLGQPDQSSPLASSSLGDVTTWRQSDSWTQGDTEVELALSFSEPVPEGGNRGSGLVRYNEAHRIRATVSHGL